MKILITGNGFDMANGLPTAYNDFISTIKIIKQSTLDNLPTNYISYFKEKSFIENSFQFEKEKIIDLKEKLNNVWLDFFIAQYNIYTWIDFEKQIENIVQRLDKVITKFNTEVFNVKDISIKSSNKIDTISQKSQIIDTVFDFKLIERHKFSHDNFTFNLQYCQVSNNHILHLKEDVFFQDLKKALDAFADLFDMYLNIFVEPLSDYLQANHRTELKGITHHFTFNYTNTFKKLCQSNNINTLFLHGKISTSETANNIVFGFNDVFESSAETKNYIPFTKYFQKLNNNTDYEFFNALNISSTYELEIYFWGHSLNQSDKVYIEEVFNIVTKNKKGSIKIFYHDTNSKSNILVNLISMFSGTFIVEMQRKKKLVFLESNNQNIEKELNTTGGGVLNQVFEVGVF